MKKKKKKKKKKMDIDVIRAVIFGRCEARPTALFHFLGRRFQCANPCQRDDTVTQTADADRSAPSYQPKRERERERERETPNAVQSFKSNIISIRFHLTDMYWRNKI